MKLLAPLSLGLLAIACADGGATPVEPPVHAPPAPDSPPDPPINRTPLLPPGPHWGVITGFDPLDSDPPDRLGRAQELQAQGRAAGLSIQRIQVDWSELETSPGVYNTAALREAFDALGDDRQPVFVTLSTLDSDGLTLPDYLADESGDFVGVSGLDDPVVLSAFEAFAAWLTREIGREGAWALALGNEVDLPVEDGLVTSSQAVAFFTAGAAAVKAENADMAVSVTLTVGAIEGQWALVRDLVAISDMASFNFYCFGDDLAAGRFVDWQFGFDRMAGAAQDKEVFIQELGCPAGYGDETAAGTDRASLIGSSPERQAEFFAFAVQQFLSDDQFRAATIFQLFDWSPELAKLFGDIVRDEGAVDAGDQLEESLATIGLCRWADATCRPAWGEVLVAAGALAEARGDEEM